MNDVFAVAEVLVSHAVENYGEDVDLIGYYGSHARGDAREGSASATLAATEVSGFE